VWYRYVEGKKWAVENQVGNKTIVIDDVTPKQTVYVYNCVDCVIQVNGKANNITLDKCKKTWVVFSDVLATCELINCVSMQVQCTGAVPTVAIDKVDGCQVYLGKGAANVTCPASLPLSTRAFTLRHITSPLHSMHACTLRYITSHYHYIQLSSLHFNVSRGVTLRTGPASYGAEITTAKCSEVNIMCMPAEGSSEEPTETPVPEQYVTTRGADGKWTTVPIGHSAG
jgi:hypothetical protein